ncbi:uncharacterized protein LOC136025432 [Artemia franciscana]|uniref:uncharacterized protein LOC136025432 n=1 Tax=Artemia franciscana TaxID=6661 RepID=UPI0032DB1E9E
MSGDANLIILEDDDIQLEEMFAKLVSIAESFYTDEDFEDFPKLEPIEESVTNEKVSSTAEEIQSVLLTMNHTTKTLLHFGFLTPNSRPEAKVRLHPIDEAEKETSLPTVTTNEMVFLDNDGKRIIIPEGTKLSSGIHAKLNITQSFKLFKLQGKGGIYMYQFQPLMAYVIILTG